jgi:hypothetical protein
MDKKYDIFFSYSNRDGGVARHLVAKLEEAGLSCFLAEKDIGAGEQWENQIRDAINASERMVLLITPRAKNSLWVMVEAGAAWALQKSLIAALMFVEPGELIDPIRRYQARLVETPEQTQALVNELAGQRVTVESQGQLSGQWFDDEDRDTVFFKQVGNRVVGFYDYGSGDRIVGVYRGTLREKKFEYRWQWISGQFAGHGIMSLSLGSDRLSGEWWFNTNSGQTEKVNYRLVSDRMPPWLKIEDFDKYKSFLSGIEEAI